MQEARNDQSPWPYRACDKPSLTESTQALSRFPRHTRLPKNNLPALVSALGWNAGLVSSRPLRGAEAPSRDLYGAVCLEPEPHGIVNPQRHHRVRSRRSCADSALSGKV